MILSLDCEFTTGDPLVNSELMDVAMVLANDNLEELSHLNVGAQIDQIWNASAWVKTNQADLLERRADGARVVRRGALARRIDYWLTDVVPTVVPSLPPPSEWHMTMWCGGNDYFLLRREAERARLPWRLGYAWVEINDILRSVVASKYGTRWDFEDADALELLGMGRIPLTHDCLEDARFNLEVLRNWKTWMAVVRLGR